MPIYTFLEGYDFSGKKIVPFCTHGGSGLSGTEQRIMLACPDAELLPGLAIAGMIAQKQANQAEAQVDAWLTRLGVVEK